jgi:hypothetical protein
MTHQRASQGLAPVPTVAGLTRAAANRLATFATVARLQPVTFFTTSFGPTSSALFAKHRKNRLESCGMSWIEGWTIGNELLLAWLVISSPFAVLVGLFIKSGSWK